MSNAERILTLLDDKKHLDLCRLGDADLLLSKLMRDDPIDQADACFIVQQAGFSPEAVRQILSQARVPDVPEIQEQFTLCSGKLLTAM